MSSPQLSMSSKLRTRWREMSMPISAATATMKPSTPNSLKTPADWTKTCLPCSVFMIPSAIGERTAL